MRRSLCAGFFPTDNSIFEWTGDLVGLILEASQVSNITTELYWNRHRIVHD